MPMHSHANLSYERSDVFALAYCRMVSFFLYHCRRSIHSATYAFLRLCVYVCSLSKFVPGRWESCLAFSVLAHTARNSRKCCSAVSVTWASR